MAYQGSCHCGAVVYEFDAPIERVLECNCSICARRGHLLAFGPASVFKLKRGENALSDYQFGKKTIHHQFCKHCGTGVFGRGAMPDGTPTIAINVRCIEGLDFKALPIDHFDGRSL